MHIQKYINLLEQHREDLEFGVIPDDTSKMDDLFEALDFAIDSLKAVDESLNGPKNEEWYGWFV